MHALSVQFSHVRLFSDSRNMQKSVTQIIYLRPLPRTQSELEIWALGLGTIERRVTRKGDVTMTN